MSRGDSFSQLLCGVEAGDSQAEERLFDEYWQKLVALAFENLSSRLRQREDPEDVVQSVYKSLVGMIRQGKCNVKDRHDFWKLLVVITLNKCRDRATRYQAQKRDIRKNVSLEAGLADNSTPAWEPVSREPTPAEAAELNDLIESLMNKMNQRDQKIFALALQERSIADISAEVGRSESSIRRFLEHVRNRLLLSRDEKPAA